MSDNTSSSLNVQLPAIRTQAIKLSSELVAQLRSIFGYPLPTNIENFNVARIPEAYSLVEKFLMTLPSNERDFNTWLWFSQAQFINAADGAASNFLRTYTNAAASLATTGTVNNEVFTDVEMQGVSNNIGFSVLGSLITTSQIPTMPVLLNAEISGAIGFPLIPGTDNYDFSRWGGSFYYWSMPALNRFGVSINNSNGQVMSIGDVITRNAVTRQRFVEALGFTLAKVGAQTSIDDLLFGKDVDSWTKIGQVFELKLAPLLSTFNRDNDLAAQRIIGVSSSLYALLALDGPVLRDVIASAVANFATRPELQNAASRSFYQSLLTVLTNIPASGGTFDPGVAKAHELIRAQIASNFRELGGKVVLTEVVRDPVNSKIILAERDVEFSVDLNDISNIQIVQKELRRRDFILDLNADGTIKVDATGNFMRLGYRVTEGGLIVENRYSRAAPANQHGLIGNEPNIVSANIRIPNNPIGIEFSDAGALIGQILGNRLANGNALVGVVASAALKTLGDSLGDVLDGLLFSTDGKANGLGEVVDKAFSQFGDEFLSNLKSAGIGAISSFLTAELVKALGLSGFAGALANSAAGAYMSAIIQALPQLINNSTNLGTVLGSVNVGNVIGGFLGSYLASKVVNFETVGGQIGSAVGTVLAPIAVNALLAPAGLALTPIGFAVVAFIGFILGGLIGSIFGGTPRSGADAQWDASQKKFVVANVWSKKGGSKDAAKNLATAAADTINGVLSSAGGTLLNPEAVQVGNYGMRKSDYVYQTQASQDQNFITFRTSSKQKDSFNKVVGYGVFQALTDSDFKIVGGNVFVKRAIYNTFSSGSIDANNFDINILIGNIASAQRFEKYKTNEGLVKALVDAEPDSAFATETLITLARARELGIVQRSKSDWYGGYSYLLSSYKENVANVKFGFRPDASSGQAARIIRLGTSYFEDTIDVAGQSLIESGTGGQLIDLRTGKLTNQIGYTVNGHLNNDIALAGTDFTGQASTTISFTAGSLRTSATVTGLTDATATEAAEKFLGQLSNGTGVSIIGGAAEATIIDGAAALPTLVVGRSYALEQDAWATFRLSLSKALTGGNTVSVGLAAAGVNATSGAQGVAGADFNASLIEVSANGVSGWQALTSVTFTASVSEYFARVKLHTDNGVDAQGKPTNIEGNERFTLTATVTAGAALVANAADGGGVVSASGTGTIVDASVGTTPLAWIDSVVTDEASGSAVFSIARSSGAGTASLTFSTADTHELTIDVAATVDAGDGDDTVYASNLGDNLFGGAGADKLFGGKLDDWLLGGDGNDTLNAGGPAAYTSGGDGNYLNGGAGDDLLIGREGSDWLEGGDGVDRLEGGLGDDILAGGAGAGDVMHGGLGDDQYIVRLGDGIDTVRDESGVTLDAVVEQTFSGFTPANLALYKSLAASGALFNGFGYAGLNNWRGGGVQATSSGVAAGGEDALVMGAGITLEDIKIGKSADGKDLWIEVWPEGVFSGDKVTLSDWFSAFNKIEILRFADGNEIRLSDLDSFILGSGGDETLVGTAGNDFIHSGGGDDVVFALSGNDIANGGLGNDSVSGDSGNDIVFGGDGVDTVLGGFGQDTVSGGRGNDRVAGGDGNDIVSGGQGDDEVIGGQGNDVFKFQRGDGKDVLIDALSDEWELAWISGAGAQSGYSISTDGNVLQGATVIYDGSAWSVRTRYDVEQGKLWVHKPANAAAVVANSGSDTIEFGIGIDINDIQFQATNGGKDLSIGIEPSGSFISAFGSLGDQIALKEWGPAGNAVAEGLIEKMVFFNTGAIDTSATGYKLTGGTDGDDTALSGTAARMNWVTGGAGDDTVSGAELDDLLNGNSGQDTLKGLAGNDILLGGGDDDVLIGGIGGDKLIGGEGLDTASYETAGAAVNVSLTTAPSGTSDDATGDTFDSIENLRGSNFNDTLEGDYGENDLRGGTGADLLKSGGGDDTYIVGRGDGTETVLDVASGGEIVVVDANDKLQPPYTSTVQLVDRDTAAGVWQFEHIVTNTETGEIIYRKETTSAFGVGFFDGIDGGLTPPTTFDPTGWVRNADDTPIYTIGSDGKVSRQIAAPGGSDTILFEDYTGNAGMPASDLTIGMTDLTFTFDTLNGKPNDLWITLNSVGGLAATKVIIQNFRNGGALDGNSAIETIQFSDGSSVNLSGLRFNAAGAFVETTADANAEVDDLIITNVATLTGGKGNDTLVGGSGNNTLLGGDGDDILIGGFGADVLNGGLGVDTANYVGSDAGISVNLANVSQQSGSSESSSDQITDVEDVIGSQYNDTITGSNADNVLKGNRGDDTISGGGGSGITKGVGMDVLLGGDGKDTLTGGVHDDNLDGGSGNDLLEGGGDSDVLAGGDGDDILRGDTGNSSGNDLGSDDVGGGLIVNGSFENALDGSVNAGWTSTSTATQFLTTGVTGLTGTRALHLEAAEGNISVSQAIKNLAPGDYLTLQFNLAGKVAGASATVEVLWNGVVIGTYTNPTTALTNATIALNDATLAAAGAKFNSGTNTLAFRGAGVVDGSGGVIDNVRLSRSTGVNVGAADQLIGGAGNDRLVGGGGNDTLLGGDGNDNKAVNVTAAGAGAGQTFAAGLYGGSGDDVLDGGAGNDTLDGGTGNDKYVFRAGEGNDIVTTGGGLDELIFDKINAGQLWLSEVASTTTVGNFDLLITAIGLGSSALVKDWRNASGPLIANIPRRIIAADKAIALSDITTTLLAAYTAQSATVPTTVPANPSTAFTTTTTAAWQNLDAYVDRFVYTGTSGNNTITADPILQGGVRFFGLAGTDTLTGGSYDDEFHFGVDAGFKTLDGKAGTDSIVADVNNATIGLAAITNIEKITGNGKTGVIINYTNSSVTATFDLTNVEVDGISEIRGSTSATVGDTVIGSAGDDFINGQAGGDTLNGGAGNDTIRGGAGNDTLDGGAGIDIYDASDIATGGTITLSSTVGTTHVSGTATDSLINFENIIAGSGNDTLTGSDVANVLNGGAGIDVIDGGAGDDTLIGGVGADTLKGGLGIDTASYVTQSAASSTTSNDTTSGTSITINGVLINLKLATSTNGTTAPLPANLGAQGDAAGDWFYQVENLTGTNFNDKLTGDDFANVLAGGAGTDVLLGGLGDDTLQGDAGNDYLDGGAGTNVAVFAGNLADYQVNTLAMTVTGLGSFASDGVDKLVNIQRIRFKDYEVSLGFNPANGPQEGAPPMSGQTWNDIKADQVSFTYSYTIPATTFIDVNLANPLTFTATLPDGSARPSWLNFDAASRTFSYVPVTANPATWAPVGSYEIKVTATDTLDSGLSLSRNVVFTITQANGLTLSAIAGVPLAGTVRPETMQGSTGDDIFLGSAGADFIDGGLGQLADRVDYSASASGVTVDLSLETSGTQSGGDAQGDTLKSIEQAVGSAYNDGLSGNNADNLLSGNAGSDILVGNGGNDTLDGGAGADTLIGGDGGDTIHARTAASGELEDDVDGGDGIDTLDLMQGAHGAIIDLAAGNPRSIENVTGTAFADSIKGNLHANTLSGGAGDDVLSGANGSDTLNGGDGTDSLYGENGDDKLYGGIGDDYLIGGAGADRLEGEAGSDWARYDTVAPGVLASGGLTVDLGMIANNTGAAAGDSYFGIENVWGTQAGDILRGDGGANILYGDAGDDTISGLAGNDQLNGHAGTDSIDGGDGSDSLMGGADNDTLAGGLGTDTLAGEDGNDTLIGGDGADTFVGGLGSDTVSYYWSAIGSSATVGVTVDMANGASSTGVALGDNFAAGDVERVQGTQLADSLYGDSNTNTLDGDAGDDILDGRDGNDTLLGGAGNDTLIGGAGVDILNGGDGNDTFNLIAVGADTIDGGLGIDTLDYSGIATYVFIDLSNPAHGLNIENVTSGIHNDSIHGNSGANVFSGGAGGDYLYGKGGADTLIGGDHNDVLFGGSGGDTFDGGTGVDLVDYSLTDALVANTVGVVINLTTGAASGGDADGDVFVSGTIEAVRGTSARDLLTGNDGYTVFYGGGGNDDLFGLGANDILYGEAGNDLLDGGIGNDGLNGGDGDDQIVGADGADTLNGDAGNDTIFGGNNGDTINGGDGGDTIHGEAGADTIQGGLGNDTIHAIVVGEDTIDGGADTDTVSLAAATSGQIVDLTSSVSKITNVENVVGTAFNDQIYGTGAANVIDGSGGDDVIQGGANGDTLTGGAGIDRLSYTGSGQGADFNTTTAIGGSVVNGVTIASAVVRTLNGVNVDIAGNTATGADATSDIISGFENLEGSAYADLLRGSSGNTIVIGGAGHDVIYGGAGNDTLYGDDGDDFLFGEAGFDTIYGGNGDDRLFGEGDPDTLYGGAGNDLLDAGDAGDILYGEGGDDIMVGGLGDDQYFLTRTSGSDTIYNYSSTSTFDDVVQYAADIAKPDLWFTKVTGTKDLKVKVLGTTSQVVIKDWFQNTTAGDFNNAGAQYVLRMFIAGQSTATTVDSLSQLLTVMAPISEPTNFAALTGPQQTAINNAWIQNTPPTIVAVAGNPTTLNEDGSAVLYFDVNDNGQTPLASIGVLSSETGAVHVQSIEVVAGNEGRRRVTVTGQPNASGAGSITLTATDSVFNSTPLATSLTVAPIADGVTLGAATNSFTANAGSALSLTGLSAALIDTDGSEIVDYLFLDGLTVGTVVASGGNSFTATAGNTSASITGWNLATLSLTPVAGSATDMTLRLRGRSRDGSAGGYVYSADNLGTNIALSVNGPPNAPTLSLDGTSSFSENSAAVRIATLTRTDPDGTTPTLVLNGADAAYFQILNNTEVWTVANLDYEAINRSTLNLSVVASDGALTGAAWTRAVTFNNGPDAPNTPTLASNGINAFGENEAAQLVATLNRSDPDGTVPTLVLTGVDAAYFQILNGNQVWTVAGLNYEVIAKTTLNVVVSATDGTYNSAGSWTKAVTFNNANEDPAFTSAASATVNENTPYSDTSGVVALMTLTSSDLDGAIATWGTPSHTFSIFTGDTTKFEIVGNVLRKKAGVLLDYDVATGGVTSHSLTIRVTDGGGRWANQTFTVNVGAVNEDPYTLRDNNATAGTSLAGPVGAVNDGAAAGTTVGITALASDPENNTLRYAITAGNPLLATVPLFAIDAASGVVTLNRAIEFERDGGNIPLVITAYDQQVPERSTSATFNVTVSDVNETPGFTSAASVNLSESTPDGNPVFTVTTSDPDTSATYGVSSHRYSIVGGTGASLFSINATSGLITTTSSGAGYDYESNPSHTLTLTIRVIDNAGVGIPVDQAFTVNITNANPFAPTALSATTVNEGAAYSATISGGSDPGGGTVTYEFSSGGGNPGGKFNIVGNSLVSVGAFDFDTLTGTAGYTKVNDTYGEFTVKLVSKDALGAGPEAIFTVRVNNANDLAPNAPVVAAWGTTSYTENVGYGGTVIATFTAPSDPDGALTALSYAITSGDTAKFEIVGNQLRVKAGVTFDADAATGGAASYAVQVQAFDGVNYSGAWSTAVSITNVDDNLPVAQGISNNGATIDEQANGIATIIAQAFADDLDGDGIVWSIVGGNPNGTLGINPSGQLFVAKLFDYETLGGVANLGVDPSIPFAVTVRAAQANNSGRYVDQVLGLQVADISEDKGVYVSGTIYPLLLDLSSGDWQQYYYDVGFGFIEVYISVYTEFWSYERYAVYNDLNGNISEDPGETAWESGGGPNGTTYAGYYWSGSISVAGSILYRQMPPIVLDLNNDGQVSSSRTTTFDITGDGRLDSTAWINPGDAFLALDRNRNGTVDNGSEISFLNDLPGATTDLEGLAAYDSNGDRQFDAQDTRFSEFLVWQDANSDGVSQAGELRSLADAGIAAIDLNVVKTAPSDEGGVAILGTSTFTRSDGTSGAVGDVALRWNDIPAAPASALAAQQTQLESRELAPADMFALFEPGTLAAAPGVGEVDPALSLDAQRLLQSMAVFGAGSGESDLIQRKPWVSEAADLFAAQPV